MIKRTLIETDKGSFVSVEPVDVDSANRRTLIFRTLLHGDLLVNPVNNLPAGESPRRIVIDNGTGILMGVLQR